MDKSSRRPFQGKRTCQAKGNQRLGMEWMQRVPRGLSGHSEARPASVLFVTGTERVRHRRNGGPTGEAKAVVREANGPALLQEPSPLGISWKTRREGIKTSQTQRAPETLAIPLAQSLARSPATASKKTSRKLCVLENLFKSFKICRQSSHPSLYLLPSLPPSL